MDTVAFINTEVSRQGDLILSFVIEDNRWPGGVRSLVLLRCPAFEGALEENERGISVSMEGERGKKGDIAGSLLSELDASAGTIRVKSPRHTYELDIRKIEPQKLAEMQKFLVKMNFDGKARISPTAP